MYGRARTRGSRRHCLVDVLSGRACQPRRIAGAGRLPEGHDVRLEGQLVGGEPRSVRPEPVTTSSKPTRNP